MRANCCKGALRLMLYWTNMKDSVRLMLSLRGQILEVVWNDIFS